MRTVRLLSIIIIGLALSLAAGPLAAQLAAATTFAG
jgi:hypothetical protein